LVRHEGTCDELGKRSQKAIGTKMHELVQAVIEKYREKHKEVEEYLRSQGDTQVAYSPGHIKMLADLGKIPQELASWFFKDYEAKRMQYNEFQNFIKNNPDIPVEERHRHFFKEGALSPEENAKVYEDMALGGQLLMCLLQNRHLLSSEPLIPVSPTRSLFNDINIVEEFGIANCISNSLYHLEELLKNMVIDKLYENMYEAKSSVKNTKGEAISLNYSFQATSQEEAERILSEYKSIMVSKGLKVWLAHWLMANKQGRVEYSCPMIEIMKLIADEDREAFFSVKEKEEHWALTKILEMSKLKRERKVKKKGTGTEIVQWVEQPLVEILGGEKEMTAEEKYPTAIAVRVLMPRLDKKGFAPTIYKNSTLLLSPSDMFLAFKLQTRATQQAHGTKNLHVDWDFIFEAGNLQATALSNQRGARAKARKKMDRLKESEIIEKWDEELMGVCVTPQKQKRKPKSEVKKKKT
jgi:hypothetical protein